MNQNIIDVSWDLEKFTAQTQLVISEMTKVYDLANKAGGNSIKAGSDGGYTELKKNVVEFNKVQENTIRLSKLQESAEQARLKTQIAAAKAVKEQEAAEQQRLKTQAQQLELTKKQAAANEKAAKAYNPANVPFVVNPVNNDELKNATTLVNEVDQAEAAAALSAAEFGNSINKSTTALNEQGIVAKKVNSESIRDKEIQKQLERQANQELKNSVREQLAAKGSLEQRRAALIRLNAAYDNLNATERNSPFGIRLQKTIAGVTTQVKELEYTTGRAQRNVGNYGSAFEGGFAKAGRAATKFYGILRKVAYVLPGIGISGIVGLLAQPIIDVTMKLLGLGEASEEVKKQQQDMEDAFKSAGDSAATEISKVTVLKTVLDSENTSRAQKITALKELKETNVDYFGQLDIEDGKVKGLETSYDAYIAKLLRSINIKANEEQLTAALKEQNEVIGKINQSRETGFKHTIANLTEYERRTAIAEFNLNFGQGKNGNKIITPQQDQLIVDLLNKKDLVKKIMDDMKANIQDDFNPKPPKKEKDKTKAAVMESTKDQLDAEFELYKIAQQRKIKLLDEEQNDTKKAWQERIIAAGEFQKATIELSDKTYQHEIDNDKKKLEVLKENYKKAKGTEKNNIAVEIENATKEIIIAQAKQQDARIDLEKSFKTQYEKIAKETEADRLKTLEEAEKSVKNVRQNQQGAIDAAQATEIGSLDKLLSEKLISQEEYNKRKARFENDALILSLQSQIKEAEGLKAIAKLKGESVIDFDNKITELTGKLQSAQSGGGKKPPKDDPKDILKSYEDAAKSAQELITGLVDNGYQREINAIQKIIDLNNQRKDQEIANINASTLSNQEKAAQMLILDNTVAANNRKLEREKTQIAIKQAKFDRDAAILEILENAAIAEFSIAKWGPAGIAQGIAIGVAAAAQIAMIMSKPLPQMPAYAMGTDNHPGGPAIVGEGKYKELVTEPSGKSFIASRPMLMHNLPKGSKVTPLKENMDMINQDLYNSMVIGTVQRIQAAEMVAHKNSNKDIVDAIELGSIRTVQAMKKQKSSHVTVNIDGNWGAYISKVVKE